MDSNKETTMYISASHTAGVYNETAFAALDYILDTAAYNNVKVIFTMGDNWQYEDAKRNVSCASQLHKELC